MSFFGLTSLGTGNCFKPKLASLQNLNDYSDEIFQEAFNQCENPNTHTIPIDDIRIVLSKVFKSEPSESDVKAITQYLHNPNTANEAHNNQSQQAIDWTQFSAGLKIAKAKRASAGSSGGCEFQSNCEYRAKIAKHQALQFSPNEKYRAPVTTSQEIGWYPPQQVERIQRKPNISCAETRYASELVKAGIYF